MNQNSGLLPFDDIRALVDELPGFDAKAANVFAAHARRPADRIVEIGTWMAGWQAVGRPVVRRPVIALFAASHALAADLDDGLQISEVMELVEQAQARSGPVAKICGRAELGLKVFELALELPVEDFSVAAAMAETDCAATIAYGMEATTDGCDLLAVCGVAAGGQASTAAMSAALLGEDDRHPEQRSPVETEVISKAIAAHKSHLQSPLELLRRLGGREAAAIAGAIVAARLQRVPVILDGSQAVCVALLLERLRQGISDHCMVSCSDLHPDSTRLCKALGRPVLLSGSYGDQDGTSGALAASVVMDVVSMFDEAG
ncbi:nicotinate-nucleotide--dimethylbenzimidazole phosphoribosyltransferase [Anderseniella sp. Alg231-50]|uniref:nicotinate-nucleotide--dimethylbenzimidazole phosphoribosyltransferase n=1 Tax=Anderseniella sp. Alg231-50 TaxID=1922226 RepID=UPI00307B6B9C